MLNVTIVNYVFLLNTIKIKLKRIIATKKRATPRIVFPAQAKFLKLE